MDEVQHRFSREDSARKWNDLYSRDTEVLEEVSFRERRDFTVDVVTRSLPPGGRVLDLGCGTGPVVAALRARKIDCVGVDYSPDMLDFARERLRAQGLDDSQLQQGDCRATGFPAASFDAVVCLGVISYVENYELVLTEIRRILKPGGLMILSFRNRLNPVLSDPVALAKKAVKRLIGRRDPQTYEIGQFLDPHEFLRRVAPFGFRFVEFRGLGIGPFKFAGRTLCGASSSVKVSHALDRLFTGLRLGRLTRWMADVSIWVYRAP